MLQVGIELSYVDSVLVPAEAGFLVEVMRRGLYWIFTVHGFVVICLVFGS
jgi:hypothetical protein